MLLVAENFYDIVIFIRHEYIVSNQDLALNHRSLAGAGENHSNFLYLLI